MSKLNGDVLWKSRIDAIAKLLAKEYREDFYRLMAHLHDVEPDDEILQIVEAMGFLGLIIGKAPAEVAAEREKLEKLLLQQAPEAMATERKELAKILSSSVSQMQEAARTTSQYHAQLESRLTKLPEAIVKGIAPETIASRIGESLHQHLLQTGINNTVDGINSMAEYLHQASGKLHETVATIAHDENGVLPKLNAAVISMEGHLEDGTRHVVEMSRQLRSQAKAWPLWGVIAVLGFISLWLVVHWPTEASKRSIQVDPTTLVQLPPNAVKLMSILKYGERQIGQLQEQVKQLQGQVHVQERDELQGQLQAANEQIRHMLPCMSSLIRRGPLRSFNLAHLRC